MREVRERIAAQIAPWPAITGASESQIPVGLTLTPALVRQDSFLQTLTAMHILLERHLKSAFPSLLPPEHRSLKIGNGWEPLLRWFCAVIWRDGRHVEIEEVRQNAEWGKLGTIVTTRAAHFSWLHARQRRMADESALICGRCGGEGGRLARRIRSNAGGGVVMFRTCDECLDLCRADGDLCSWAERWDDD